MPTACVASGQGPLLYGPSWDDRGGRRDRAGLTHSPQGSPCCVRVTTRTLCGRCLRQALCAFQCPIVCFVIHCVRGAQRRCTDGGREEWPHCSLLLAYNPTGPGGGMRATAMHKSPRHHEGLFLLGQGGAMGRRELEGSLWKAAHQPKPTSLNNPPCMPALIYSWDPGSNWQE